MNVIKGIPSKNQLHTWFQNWKVKWKQKITEGGSDMCDNGAKSSYETLQVCSEHQNKGKVHWNMTLSSIGLKVL